MNALVAYYSTSGRNKRLAELISEELGCDSEGIVDLKERPSAADFSSKPSAAKLLPMFSTGLDVLLKRGTRLGPLSKKPSEFDLLILGTPIWMGNMPPATRAYANSIKGQVKNLSLFCIDGRSEPSGVFAEIENTLGVKAQKRLWVTMDKFDAGDYKDGLKDFVSGLKS